MNCPKHNVPMHVYTTFSFCPECEKEPKATQQVQESAEKALAADRVLSLSKKKPCKFAWYTTYAAGWPKELYAIIKPNSWVGSCQMSYLFRRVASATAFLLAITEPGEYQLVLVNSVPQSIHWEQSALEHSEHEWAIYTAGTTNLNASSQKAEIVRPILTNVTP